MKQTFFTTSRLLLVLSLLFLCGGLYVLLLTLAPRLGVVPSPYSVASSTELPVAVVPTENSIYIEKLAIRVPFYSGNASVLENGAWHRFPERGDPEKGGNFILSGHRFQMGLTPERTKRRSPFYDLNKLVVGDKLSVTYGGKNYNYKISRIYSVKPDANEVEAPSEVPKLTLYTCTLKGSTDGRTVIEALPTD